MGMVGEIKQNYIIVCYYTQNTGYECEVQNLIYSLDALNLNYDLHAIDTLGSWKRNTDYRPVFLQQMLRKHNQPLLWIDADARVYKHPDLCNNLSEDIGMHYLRNEPLIGTLYLANNKTIYKLMRVWASECKKSNKRSGLVLQDILAGQKSYPCNSIAPSYLFTLSKFLNRTGRLHLPCV